jgi:hypothetical protein
MNNRNTSLEHTSLSARLDRCGTSSFRRVIQSGVAGALGGGAFALVQHLDPSLLTEPALLRWVFLYALLGGVGMALWTATTRWATARFSLSHREAVLTSSLVAGTLVGTAALLAATLKQGAEPNGLLLLGLPWKNGVGGFVGGAIGGGLWRALTQGQ